MEKQNDIKIYSKNQEYRAFYDTLENNEIELNATNISIAFRGIWKFSNLSKKDFAMKIGISAEENDDYFNGLNIPTIEVLIRLSKMFNISMSLFFEPYYYSKKAFYNNDLIKFCILRITTPKKNILKLQNINKFYFNIFLDLATKIHELKEILLRKEYNGKKLSDTFIGQLSSQYYKLLEQINKNGMVSSFSPVESTLESWFYCNSESLVRIIAESIREIKIDEVDNPQIIYSFIEDISMVYVIPLEYDAVNYLMINKN